MNNPPEYPPNPLFRLKTSIKDEGGNTIVHYVIDLERVVAVDYSKTSTVGSIHLASGKMIVMKWSGAQRVMRAWEDFRDWHYRAQRDYYRSQQGGGQ